MPLMTRIVVVAMFATMAAQPAWPYVGPGVGLSLIGAFWTLLMAIFAAVGFLLLWALRRLLRRVKLVRGGLGNGIESGAPEASGKIDSRAR
jgi:membrane protein implicated in regulation of membrane protease activity